MNKPALGVKLAALNIAVLTICCLAIATALNLSAFAMASAIEAQVGTPAQNIAESGKGQRPTNTGIDTAQPHATNPSIENVGEPAHSEVDAVAHARSSYFAASILVVAGTVSLGAFCTYRLVRHETHGIEKLAQHLRTCKPENLAQPFESKATNRETHDLISSFNDLGQRTSAAIEAQSRFALAAAHELKTPLAAIRTRIDVFGKHSNPSDADIKRLVNTISTQTNRLSTLVDQLLALARCSHIQREDSVDPAEIASEVAKETSARTGIEISMYRSGEKQPIPANRELLRAAISNILNNAIAYGQPPICLQCSPDRIVVTNAGSPISPLEAERLFDPFQRGDDSRSRTSGGCGLGLATARAIMRAHGGDARFLPVSSGVAIELAFSPLDGSDNRGR